MLKPLKAVGRLFLGSLTFLMLATLPALTLRRVVFVAAGLLVLAVGVIVLRNNAQPCCPTFPRGGVDARVVRIIDGVSVEVDITGQSYGARHIGMDAPETTNGHHDPYGEEAIAYNRQLVKGSLSGQRCE